jgi:hypothetical protein
MLEEQILAQTDPQFGPMQVDWAYLYEDRLRSYRRGWMGLLTTRYRSGSGLANLFAMLESRRSVFSPGHLLSEDGQLPTSAAAALTR